MVTTERPVEFEWGLRVGGTEDPLTAVEGSVTAKAGRNRFDVLLGIVGQGASAGLPSEQRAPVTP